MNNTTAYLSNKNSCISFAYAGKKIRFVGPYSLVRFERVKEWDDGYIVVDAVYSHEKEPVEDYIDLKPVLKDLLIDADEFIKPIRKVEIENV